MIELESDRAYIAGIIDGEGCISVTHHKQLIIKIAMTDDKVIGYLAGILGCTISPSKITSSGRQCKQIQISGYRVKEVLREIVPYLIGKQSQAELALKFPLGTFQRAHSLSANDKELRAELDEAIRSYNSSKGKR